jgi:hypothetical protein
VQVVILGIINAGFMLTPTAVVSDRDIIDGQGNTLSVLAEALTKTASGNPVVISDCAGGKARSLITEINAIQDLHGQPFPYVGGAYKNKLPMTVESIKAVNTSGTWSGNVYTFKNLTFTVLTDIDNNVTGIRINGKPSSALEFYIANMSVSEACILNASASANTELSAADFYFGTYGNISSRTWTTGDASIASGASGNIALYINTNYNNDIIIHPMLRLATESDASFAPYSNICPISGRTAAVVTRSDGDEISEDFTIQLGQTVYGAEINWDTGVMTVTHAVVDGGDLDWYYWQLDMFFATKSDKTALTESDIKCSAYATLYGNYFIKCYTDNKNQRKNIYINNPSLAHDATGAAALKTAITGQQIEYRLATPTTIQLTPTMLELLKGYNRVTIDNGSIELGYIAKLT